ncbi:hypothetical protein [Loigolactobacillus coryniformis]|uniref:Uncharacterized protein n=1 Tax=Loigolactobacillus coryniformis TaxID=1610 RepID=A0A5B8TJA7_9LACO|nr:hypothetical protein [Loigolactobacillus coryniformis]QEA53945.1 hypothetical protein FGL77_12020 [Loigolactobacillus coryniformis]
MPAIKQVEITSKITTEQLTAAAKYALKQNKLDHLKTVRRYGVITNAIIVLIPTALIEYFLIAPSLRLYLNIYLIIVFLLMTHHFKNKDFKRLETRFLDQVRKTPTTATTFVDQDAQIRLNDKLIKPELLLRDPDYYYLFYIAKPTTPATYNLAFLERSPINNNLIQTDLSVAIDQFEQSLKDSAKVVLIR